MVRVNKMVNIAQNLIYIEGACVSADTKPTEYNGKDIANGSVLTEANTGDVYMYNESTGWAKMFGLRG